MGDMGADPARGKSPITFCCDSDKRRGSVEDEALDGAGADWGVLTGFEPPIPGELPGGPPGDGELVPPSCKRNGVRGVDVEAGYGLAPPYWLYPALLPGGGAPAL